MTNEIKFVEIAAQFNDNCRIAVSITADALIKKFEELVLNDEELINHIHTDAGRVVAERFLDTVAPEQLISSAADNLSPDMLVNKLHYFLPENVCEGLAERYLHDLSDELLAEELFSRDAVCVIKNLTDLQQIELLQELISKPDELTQEVQAELEYAANKHIPMKSPELQSELEQLMKYHHVGEILQTLARITMLR